MKFLIAASMLFLFGCSDIKTTYYTPLIPAWFVKKMEDSCVNSLQGQVDTNDSRVIVTNYTSKEGKQFYSIKVVVRCNMEKGRVGEIVDSFGGGSGMQYDFSKDPK